MKPMFSDDFERSCRADTKTCNCNEVLIVLLDRDWYNREMAPILSESAELVEITSRTSDAVKVASRQGHAGVPIDRREHLRVC